MTSGFRAALDQAQYEQAALILGEVEKTVALNPSGLNPVYRFVLDSLPTILEVQSGHDISVEEKAVRFQQAWSMMADYHPNDQLEKNVAWYHGRYATKFWMEQLIAEGQFGMKSSGTGRQAVQEVDERVRPRLRS
jgi:hypothetical protein